MSVSRTVIRSLAAIVAIGAPLSLSAQSRTPCPRPRTATFTTGQTVIVESARQYPCRLTLVETGLRISSDIAGTVPDPGENVVMDSRGRIYSSPGRTEPGKIGVWKPDGKFDRYFGQRGNGPQEFQQGNFMLFLDGTDRLHVLTGSRQWSVLSPALDWVSQVPTMPILVDDDFTIVLHDGMVVTSATSDSLWFGVGDFKGNLISRFGNFRTLSSVNSQVPTDHLRTIAHAGGTRFWVTPERGAKEGYSVDMWSTDGKRHLTFRRRVSWFPDGAGAPIPRTQRPPPYLFRVHADTAANLLFTLTVIANEKWDQAQTAPPADRRALMDQAYTLHIEVIDARAGIVLASEVFPPPGTNRLITRFMPGRMMAYRHVETPDGLVEVRFVELRLTGS